MENVILTIHLILALLLIGVVLLQRSEGGGLGMGGGGGGAISARGAANALTKLTWIFAAGFIVTSLTLTILAARDVGGSVTEQIGGSLVPQAPAPAATDLTLPAPSSDAPLAPPRPEAAAPAAPAAPAPATPAAPTAPAAPAPAN